MVTYEITATVRKNLCQAYESYMLTRHIDDLMRTKHFVSATFSRSKPGRYRIRYEAADRSSLEKYLSEDAPRLREHLSKTFPDGIDLSREEWEVMGTFEKFEID
jgi:hypothetical protein